MTTTPTPTPTMAAFSTTRADLLAALRTVGIAVPTRAMVSLMAGVLLESDGPDLLVGGFDYETAVRVRIPDAAQSPGRLLVRHSELTKLVAELARGVGKRSADQMRVSICAQDSAWATVELAGTTIPLERLAEEDYPQLPTMPPTLARVPRQRFATETTRVLRAVSRDEALPVLTGLRVDVSAAGLTLSGTDRYRLAMGHVPAAVNLEQTPERPLLLYGRSLEKTLPKLTGEQITVGYRSDDFSALMGWASGEVTVVMRTMDPDQEYPKCQALLPGSAAITVVADRGELLAQAARAAGALRAKDQPRTPLVLGLRPDGVTLAPALEEGAHYVRTPVLKAQVRGLDEPMWVGLNQRYLTEALESFTAPTITLHLQSPTKPVVLTDTPEGISDATAFRHLLMPIRLGS